MEELYKSKVQVNKKRKDIKDLVICSKILHTQILHHVGISWSWESAEQGISEQAPVIKVKKSELK